jgi:hypothetical protein
VATVERMRLYNKNSQREFLLFKLKFFSSYGHVDPDAASAVVYVREAPVWSTQMYPGVAATSPALRTHVEAVALQYTAAVPFFASISVRNAAPSVHALV